MNREMLAPLDATPRRSLVRRVLVGVAGLCVLVGLWLLWQVHHSGPSRFTITGIRLQKGDLVKGHSASAGPVDIETSADLKQQGVEITYLSTAFRSETSLFTNEETRTYTFYVKPTQAGLNADALSYTAFDGDGEKVSQGKVDLGYKLAPGERGECTVLVELRGSQPAPTRLLIEASR